MALSHKARKRWSIFVLVVGLPIWIIIAVNLADLVSRDNVLVELAVFVVLGVVWIFPFKNLFKGVAAAPPEDEDDGT
jgi:predicted membrane channel-forming protein YqfA (hemolysin III family)